MKCLPPDYQEQRGDSVLLVWGDLPFWLVVDRPAAAFISRLAGGEAPAAALAASGGSAREGASVLAQLRRAGVIGARRPREAPPRLESLSVNVTNRCNLACPFCYNAGRETPDELSAAELVGALEGLRPFAARGALLALLGGEPLLEPEKTLALARWARRHRLQSIVSTNGLLVDERFARQAAALGLHCQVSLDGATAETHEAMRGPGTFAAALRAVEVLLAAGAATLVSLVFHAGNAAEVPQFLRLARELGVQEARFIPVKRVGGGGGCAAPDLAAMIRQVVALLQQEPTLGRLLGRDYVSILAGTCRSCTPRGGCGTASQTLLLDADGTIYPCPNLARPQFAGGRVGEAPVRQIWRRSPALSAVRAQARTAGRHGCAGCFLRNWCLGGCRGEAFAVSGDLQARSPACAEHRAAILEMFWTLSAHHALLETVRSGRAD